jgi:hypothetical protein
MGIIYGSAYSFVIYYSTHHRVQWLGTTGLVHGVFNATFNNISVISWQSVLIVKETRVPGENHRPVAGHG